MSSSDTSLLARTKAALQPSGFNLIGSAAVADYDRLVPPQYRAASLFPAGRTLMVIGNGGGDLWRAFQVYCRAHPGYMQRHEHPLDDYTIELIEGSLSPLFAQEGVAHRYLYPFRFATQPVSFMHLAQAARLAGPSILGVVIHPVFGPWIALRAAVFVDQDLCEPPAAPGFDPCPACSERPCLTACPGRAVNTENGWDIPVCVQHRLRVPGDCVDLCHARYQCVYGREYRYPLDELRYHQRRSFARMTEYMRQKG
jgi:epoxyqueuosine reductase